MDLTNFKNIKDYEGLYMINSNGDIYNCKRKNLMKSLICKGNGYFKIGLTKNNKQKTYLLHRLIAIHFIENPNNYELVDHIDNNRINNKLDNLRWVDYSGNIRNRTIKRTQDLPRGVYKDYNRYKTCISLNNKQIYLGMFKTVEEASEAYEKKFKEFMNKY